jgi:N-acetylmuramoyl-L-alanine amidase
VSWTVLLPLLLAACGEEPAPLSGGPPGEVERGVEPSATVPPAAGHSADVVVEPVGPPIEDRLLPHDEERCALTHDYLRAHHPEVAAGRASASCEMAPRMVVLHWTAGPSVESAWNTFAPARLGGRPELQGAGAVNVAAHFLVARDGTILRLLPETRVARHCIGLNHLSLGIENVGGDPEHPLTEAQIEANAALIRALSARHDITHLIGHLEYRWMESHPYFQELDPDYRTAKSDPGPDFMEAVRSRVGDLGLEGPPSH